MKLTNDSYLILIGTRNFTERYYRDAEGWVKVSARGRKFRMTAEQVLNHVLPAMAGIKPNLAIEVAHRSRVGRPRRGSQGTALSAKAPYPTERLPVRVEYHGQAPDGSRGTRS